MMTAGNKRSVLNSTPIGWSMSDTHVRDAMDMSVIIAARRGILSMCNFPSNGMS